ncbi:MAG: efflux RND transporter periplasmic adaptor subunit [Candidatus Fibromonas sp.]|jgi:HlyD family secretion protein|nr:efflux RND transporter periplasmic adaptor subunit [Candidatus Fibromonas sp.]
MKKLILIATLILISCGEPKQNYLQGQFEAHRVWVSSKVPGRLRSVLAEVGDSVSQGQILAELESPEIEAKKKQASGALKAAESQSKKAKAGARKEEIAAAEAMANRAQEAANLAKATYERVQQLYDEGVLPAQKRDEAFAGYATAKAAAEAASAQLEMAKYGARKEDREAADALVLQASGAEAEINAYLEETALVSPINGEIASRNAEQGELVGSGMAVFSVIDRSKSWAVFNVREDLLKDLSKGTVIKVWIPALKQNADLEIYSIAPLGDFATWRSSKETGGFDLKTFEIKARPKESLPHLRPGMSALLPVETK